MTNHIPVDTETYITLYLYHKNTGTPMTTFVVRHVCVGCWLESRTPHHGEGPGGVLRVALGGSQPGCVHLTPARLNWTSSFPHLCHHFPPNCDVFSCPLPVSCIRIEAGHLGVQRNTHLGLIKSNHHGKTAISMPNVKLASWSGV